MAEGNPPAYPDPFDPTTGAPQAGMPHPMDADAAAAHQPAGVANVAKKPAPPPKRKRRRRWPFVLLALVLLLALLVLFAPTIAGTSPVRSIVLGQVNQRINGRVEVADWSLGWTSPVTVSGLKVFDKAGSLILELPRLTTELRLIDAARGKLHFGQVTVDGLSALVRRDPKGNVNLTELTPPSSTPTPPSAGPTKLPDVSGELHLVNCRVTFEDRQQGQTFYFPSIAGTVKCPDVNGPIENHLEVACKVGDAPAGKLTINGRADVADANEIKPDTVS
jgi:hypothetical protein